MIHTTCPSPHCNYRKADLHETTSHVIIYCQNCGYTREEKRRNANSRPVPAPKLMVMPGGTPANSKLKKKKKKASLEPIQRAG